MHGKELPRATQPFYFAVNKPKGYLCANAPNKEGTTKLVVNLFEVGASFALHPSQLHPTGPSNRLNATETIHGSVTSQHWLPSPLPYRVEDCISECGQCAAAALRWG